MNKLLLSLAPLLAVGCAYVVDPVKNQEPQGLIINEVLSVNGKGIVDEFGERSDWIELFNAGTDPVNLGDYALSDKSGNRQKWIMGDSILKPGEFALIFASGKDIPKPRSRAAAIDYPIGWVGAWADGEMGSEWTSFVKPWNAKSIYENGLISVVLYLGNNDGQGWMGQSSISVSPSQAITISGYNQLEFTGYIEKGKKIEINFPQKSWAEQVKFEQYFSSVTIPVIGTGNPNETYKVQLNSTTLDSSVSMDQINGISFNYNEFDDSVHMAISDIRFSQSETAMHAPFSIDADGSELFLTTTAGKTVDSVAIPSLAADCSWGRSSSMRSQFGFCRRATPGKTNDENSYVLALGSAVKSSLNSGFYRGPVQLELVATTGYDEIHYTTDGSIPTANSPRYTAPLTIAESGTIRSASFRNGVISDTVTTRTFLIETAPSIPVVCITVDSLAMFDSLSGIHSKGPKTGVKIPYFGSNFWDESEIPATIEYFENGNKAFEKNVGISIQGNFSKSLDKKGFALTCRREYSAGSFEYPFFPDHPQVRSFNSLILRGGSQHQEGVFFFDAYRASLSEGMGIAYQKYRPALVYINGKYWGIYGIQEKLNEHYMASNYGIDPSNVSLIKEAGVIQSGTADHYIALLNYVRSCAITTDAAYNYINTQMDVLNYSDYFSTLFYLTNNDWPANNIKWWRDRSSNSRWQWMIYDTDAGVSYDYDMVEHTLNDTVSMGAFPNGSTFTVLFRTLLKNERFRSDFINRTAVLLNTQFHPSRTEAILNKMTSEVTPYWDRDFQRWGYSTSVRKFWLDQMHLFNQKRPEYLRKHLSEWFDLGSAITGTISSDRGSVLINGINVGRSVSGTWFEKSPLRVTLTDSTGFVRWSDGVTTASRTISLENGAHLNAEFR